MRNAEFGKISQKFHRTGQRTYLPDVLAVGFRVKTLQRLRVHRTQIAPGLAQQPVDE